GTSTHTPIASWTGMANYTFTPVTVSYTINAKQAIATAPDGGGVYNGTAYPGSGTCSNGLTPVITYTPGPGAPVNFGTTGFTVTCAGTNYLDGTATGSIVITRAAVTATAGSGSSTFDTA